MTAEGQNFLGVFVIGGSINSAGIARDEAGRRYAIGLAETNEFGGATSPASTTHFNGSQRGLGYCEFGLPPKPLIVSEVLQKAMPQISEPLRLVLPMFAQIRLVSTQN